MAPPSSFLPLLSDFPHLIPTTANFTHFSGFIRISNSEFRISIPSDCSSFSADKSLSNLLQPCLPLLKHTLSTSPTVHHFLLELRDIAERQLSQSKTRRLDACSSLPSARFYERLLCELSVIGWKSVSSLSENMRTVDLIVQDSSSRWHTLNVRLPIDYPRSVPKCMASLPVEFLPEWTPSSSTLKLLVDQFRKVVERFQDFFRAISDFDMHCAVLEPQHPTMRETYRRVKLDGHSSLRVELDPELAIKGFPECRFLGSEHAVSPFKERLNRNIHMWDMSGNSLPRENLEKVLEVEFPEREVEDGAGEMEGLECGICYSYRLEVCVPDIVCDLVECGKAYHRTCLVEWLRALPDTRESFGTISGRCVYCEQGISLATEE